MWLMASDARGVIMIMMEQRDTYILQMSSPTGAGSCSRTDIQTQRTEVHKQQSWRDSKEQGGATQSDAQRHNKENKE